MKPIEIKEGKVIFDSLFLDHFVKKVRGNNLTTALGIMTRINSTDGPQDITISDVATLCEFTEDTVFTALGKLNKLHINRKRVFDIIVSPDKKKASFEVMDIAAKITAAPANAEGSAAHAVLMYFGELYEAKYGVQYKFNFGRDMQLAKNKLCKQYDITVIYELINIAFKEYDRRWKNAQYTTLNFGGFCSWIHSNAYEIYKKRNLKNTKNLAADTFEDAHKDLW